MSEFVLQDDQDPAEYGYEQAQWQEANHQRRNALLAHAGAAVGVVAITGALVGAYELIESGDTPSAACAPNTADTHEVVESALHDKLPKPFRELSGVFKNHGGRLPGYSDYTTPRESKIIQASRAATPGLHWVDLKTTRRYEDKLMDAKTVPQVLRTLTTFGEKELGISITPITQEGKRNNGWMTLYPLPTNPDPGKRADIAIDAQKVVEVTAAQPKEYFWAAKRPISLVSRIRDDTVGVDTEGTTDWRGTVMVLGNRLPSDTPIHEQAHALQPSCDFGTDAEYTDLNPKGFEYTGKSDASGSAKGNQKGVVADAYGASNAKEDYATALTDVVYYHKLARSGPLRAKEELQLTRLAAFNKNLVRNLVYTARARAGDINGTMYPALPYTPVKKS